MRTKTVTVHYCDFCRKRKFTRPAMVKHEEGCTLNPNRVCRMCRMNPEAVQKPMAELIAAAIEDESKIDPMDHSGPRLIPKLREISDGCPACILAALRQSPALYIGDDFKWEDESKNWLGEYSQPHPWDR